MTSIQKTDQLSREIQQYSREDVIALEYSDGQFRALEKAFFATPTNIKKLLVQTVVATALITYQIAGSGEKRWNERATYYVKNLSTLSLEHLDERLYQCMMQSQYNKRLYNLKRKRVTKYRDWLTIGQKLPHERYADMASFHIILAKAMHQKLSDKTICFAIKMLGYIGRLVYGYFQPFPQSIALPIDSRVRQIYVHYNGEEKTGNNKQDDNSIQSYFFSLSERIHIPCLHIDSILWIALWEKVKERRVQNKQNVKIQKKDIG